MDARGKACKDTKQNSYQNTQKYLPQHVLAREKLINEASQKKTVMITKDNKDKCTLVVSLPQPSKSILSSVRLSI